MGARESLNGRENMARRKVKNGEIGQKNTKVFWHQSEARTAATVWNWSGKTLSPGALLDVLFFSSCHIFKRLALKSIGAIYIYIYIYFFFFNYFFIFSRPFRFSIAPTICPWVSDDVITVVVISFCNLQRENREVNIA